MDVLIINCGSSSQSFKIYHAGPGMLPTVIASGKARNVATQTKASPVIEWQIQGIAGSLSVELSTHRMAIKQIAGVIQQYNLHIDAIGHRFVHGGDQFSRTARVDPGTLEGLRQSFHFAPIHNPNSFSVIQACEELFPGIPQYVVFDNAFHARMPEAARTYALPRDLSEKYGLRKFGFHGLSYQYISSRMADLLGKPLDALKLIICHLGTGGSSVAAIKYGSPLDTSMGYSPLPGLVMSTRCGDIDAEVVLELVRNGFSADQVSTILNQKSGLIGLSGFSSNLQEIIESAEKGNQQCQLAYEVYAWRLRFYLGAYTWLLNRADAVIFTDDVGMKCWQLREKACIGVEELGIELDLEANRLASGDQAACISASRSRTQLWIVPTDEEIVILNEVLAQ